MFINQFLIKNLGAKEHFFFEINKYFGEKSALLCTNTPQLCIFLAIFPFFVGRFRLFCYFCTVLIKHLNPYDIYRKSQ